jgi:hypothetical protein
MREVRSGGQSFAFVTFDYANADVRKEGRNDEILRFVEFWKERTGSQPSPACSRLPQS